MCEGVTDPLYAQMTVTEVEAYCLKAISLRRYVAHSVNRRKVLVAKKISRGPQDFRAG
jgi:hypothetical protein